MKSFFFSGVDVLEPAALEQSGLTLRCDESIKCRALAILQVRLDHNPSACAYPSVMSSPLRKPWNRAGKRSYAVPTVRTLGKLQLRFARLWAFVLTRPIKVEWDENVVFHYYRWWEVCFLRSQAEYKRGNRIFFRLPEIIYLQDSTWYTCFWFGVSVFVFGSKNDFYTHRHLSTKLLPQTRAHLPL